jgi:hypothetical protein
VSVIFSVSKNGDRICTYNGLYFHSAYNPQREAERFVEAIKTDFQPQCVLVIEPGLSYCASPLRKRYPNAVLCAVRLLPDFLDTDITWDLVIPVTDRSEFFFEQIYAALGEDLLCSAFFSCWPPAETALQEQIHFVWDAIKRAVEKSRTILMTRSFFSKKWLRNAVHFCLSVHHTALLIPGSAPIIIAASGPSLESSIPFLKRFRTNFYLLAVSSACKTLAHYSITPDLCITTDGGYWAGLHLFSPGMSMEKIPLVLASEAYCPTPMLKKNIIIPLTYGDAPETILFESCKIQSIRAERNGTVSGTAAMLAYQLTTGSVFFCGLDLAPADGFQHTNPNTLEQFHSFHDNRIRTTEKRQIESRFSSTNSLKIYRSWFQSLPQTITNHFYRISDQYQFPYALGNIKDLFWKDFKKMCPEKSIFPKIVQTKNEISPAERINIVRSILKQGRNNIFWQKTLCPLESIMLQRNIRTVHEHETKKSLDSKLDELFFQVNRIVHE